MNTVAQRPSWASIWWQAIRPKTMMASVAPVAIGCAMAMASQGFHAGAAFACLWGAIWLQVGTNFANDLFDFQKGADTHERMGPQRVTQAGLLSEGTMRLATLMAFALVLPAVGFVAFRAGWEFVLLGLACIAAGLLYTGGPKPYGYLGLGEVFVLLFFGPVAVVGTEYVQTLQLNPQTVVAGLIPGFVSVSMLAVNNLRDVDTDLKAGKRTLAVRFGRTFAKVEVMGSLVVAGLAVLGLAWWGSHPWALASLVPLVVFGSKVGNIVLHQQGPALNEALGLTGRIMGTSCLLFALGWLF